MTTFPWFPIGHQIACGAVGRLRAEGAGYQVLHDQSSERLILVIASDSSAGKGAAASSVAARFGEKGGSAIGVLITDDGPKDSR